MTGRAAVREVVSVTLSDGSVIPADKLVCPLCPAGQPSARTFRRAPAAGEPLRGWQATCPAGHEWLLVPRGRDGWSVLAGFGGGVYGGFVG